MVLDEMVIQLRASAEGVKKGVAVAMEELKKLEEKKKKLAEKLKLDIDFSSVQALQDRLDELAHQKSALEEKLRLTTDVSEIEQLNVNMLELLKNKNAAEAPLNINIESADVDDTLNMLKQVNEEIKNISEKISIKIDGSELEIATQETADGFPKIAEAAAVTFDAVVSAVKSGVQAYNEYSLTMNSLASEMNGVGVSVSAAMDVVKDKTKDGLVSDSDMADSIKNLTSYGLTIEQTDKVLERLKDSAAYNRDMQYSLGEAVSVTTEGIKNGNSLMAGAAGITKDAAQMQEDYAKSLGISAESLTQAQKAQAVYNGIMEETEATIGNAAKYADTLAGAQAQQEEQVLRLAQAYGEAMAPAVQLLTECFTVVLKAVTDFISGNEGLVSFLTLVVGAVTGLAGVFGIAQLAVAAFGLALQAVTLNPFAIMIAAVVGGIVALVAISKEAEAEQAKLNERMEEYNKIKEAETTADNLSSKKQIVEDIGELVGKYDDLIAAEKEYAGKAEELENIHYEQALVADDLTVSLIKMQTTYEDLVKAASVYGIEADKSLSIEEDSLRIKGLLIEAQKEQQKSIEEYNQTLADQAKLEAFNQALQKMIKSTEGLNTAYQTLKKGEDLSTDTLMELIKLYPAVAKHIAENVNWRKTLIGVIEDEGEKSKKATIDKLKDRESELVAEKSRLEAVKAGYKQDALAANAALADKKLGLSDFLDYWQKSMDAVKSGKFIAQTAIEIVDTATLNTLDNAINAVDSELAVVRIELDKVENSFSSDKPSSNVGSSKVKAENEELKEQLRLLEERKKLKYVSSQEELEQLLEIKKLAKNDEENTEMDILIRPIRLAANDEWYDEQMKAIAKFNKGFEDNIDYQVIIDKLQDTLKEAEQRYGEDFPDRLNDIQEHIDDMMMGAEEDLADKLLAITSKSVDDRIAERERMIQLEKSKAGILDEDGNAHEFSSLDEAEIHMKSIEDIQKQIIAVLVGTNKEANIQLAELIANTKDMTDKQLVDLLRKAEELTSGENSELEKQKNNYVTYFRKVEDLQVACIKEKQAAEQKAIKDSLAAEQKATEDLKKEIQKRVKDQTEAAKKVNKEYVDSIKERYAMEIQAAEEASNSEVAIYAQQIKAIDDLMKSETRTETDDKEKDKIKRLQEQLAYEIDPTNIYELQKEITQEQTEFDKRKRKESLEDEKVSLQEQMNAVKESFGARKAELEALRDKEVEAAQQSLESYIKNLEAQTEKLAEKEAEDTKVILTEQEIRNTEQTKKLGEKEEADTKVILSGQDNRIVEHKKYLDKKKNQVDTNATEERGIMNDSTSKIISDLYLRIAEFTEAGAAAGRAWASAFAAAANSAASSISAAANSFSSPAGYSSISSASAGIAPSSYSYEINVEQAFNVPMVSPAQAAQEASWALETLLRNR